MVERLPDKASRAKSNVSQLPGDGDMLALAVHASVIGHFLITPLYNSDTIELTVKGSRWKRNKKKSILQ